MTHVPPRQAWVWCASLATVASVAALGVILHELPATATVFSSAWDSWAVAFIAIVAVNATWFGLRVGLVTAAVAALAYNFLFVEPMYAFSVPQASEYLFWASMITCALLVRPTMQAWIASEVAQSDASMRKHAEAILRLRRLRQERRDAVHREMSLEARPGRPNYEAYLQALEYTERLSAELDQVTAAILACPARSWADVVLLAELATAHGASGDHREGGFCTDKASEVVEAMLQAAMRLGSANVTHIRHIRASSRLALL